MVGQGASATVGKKWQPRVPGGLFPAVSVPQEVPWGSPPDFATSREQVFGTPEQARGIAAYYVCPEGPSKTRCRLKAGSKSDNGS